MTGILSSRLAALSAIVFAIVFVAAAMFLMGQVDSNMTAKEFADTYDKGSGRATIIVAAIVAVMATALLALFTSHLLVRLRNAEGAEAPLTHLAQTATSLLLATWVIGNIAQANVAGAVQFGGFDVPSPETAAFFSQLGTGIVLLATLFSAAALMGLTATIGFKSGALPRWLAWLSTVTAVISLFGAMLLPALAFPVWLVAMGVWLLRTNQ